MGKKELNQVMKAITRIRDPGERPAQSSTDIDVFECDLCKGDTQKQKITQCPYCGRWICKENCWHENHLACNACASIISLAQHYDENTNDTSKQTKQKSRLSEPLKSIRNMISKKK